MTFLRTAPLEHLVRDIVLNWALASPVLPRGLRWMVLRALGLDVHRSTINAGGFLGGRQISIGEGCFINHQFFIDNAAPVRIGQLVSMGPRVSIITGSHEISSELRRAGIPQNAPVNVDDGAWIGAGAVILPGVTVGRGALVAAGAVVHVDVPPDTLVGGVPARVIRSLEPLRPDAGRTPEDAP